MKRNAYKLSLFLLASLCFGIWACREENLEIKPPFPTEENFFKNEGEFTKAVYGVYAKLTDIYWYNAGQWNFASALYYLPGDDVTITDGDVFEQFGQMQPSSGRLSYFYSTLYQMVSRANIVLQKINDVGQQAYTNQNLRNYHKGEALFLRGYAFYNLWNTFGTSPIVLQRVQTSDQLTPTSSQGTQLLEQAIADFTEAATLLPDAWDPSNRGRVTKNSANGMLGKALVFKGSVTNTAADYTAALTALNKITGVSLVQKFDDNFAFDTENNAESLFEHQATQPFAFDNVWLSNDFDNAIGSMSAYYGFYDNHWSLFGRSRFFATDKLLNAFEAGDPRRELTLNPANKNIRKYVSRDKLTQSGVASANNPRILRYADVLLLKAEAILGSNGSVSQAVDLINQVRTRARNMVSNGTIPANYSTSVTDRNQVMNWLMNERLLELAGEGHRWFDLRRWALGNKLTLNNSFFSSATNTMDFAPRNLFFPIPNREIDVNPNVRQNPGY